MRFGVPTLERLSSLDKQMYMDRPMDAAIPLYVPSANMQGSKGQLLTWFRDYKTHFVKLAESQLQCLFALVIMMVSRDTRKIHCLKK
jgi:hypothetical protein